MEKGREKRRLQLVRRKIATAEKGGEIIINKGPPGRVDTAKIVAKGEKMLLQ